MKKTPVIELMNTTRSKTGAFISYDVQSFIKTQSCDFLPDIVLKNIIPDKCPIFVEIIVRLRGNRG